MLLLESIKKTLKEMVLSLACTTSIPSNTDLATVDEPQVTLLI